MSNSLVGNQLMQVVVYSTFENNFGMLKLEKFDCNCKKCLCFNSVFEQSKVCAECVYRIHEGIRK